MEREQENYVKQNQEILERAKNLNQKYEADMEHLRGVRRKHLFQRKQKLFEEKAEQERIKALASNTRKPVGKLNVPGAFAENKPETKTEKDTQVNQETIKTQIPAEPTPSSSSGEKTQDKGDISDASVGNGHNVADDAEHEGGDSVEEPELLNEDMFFDEDGEAPPLFEDEDFQLSNDEE